MSTSQLFLNLDPHDLLPWRLQNAILILSKIRPFRTNLQWNSEKAVSYGSVTNVANLTFSFVLFSLHTGDCLAIVGSSRSTEYPNCYTTNIE